MKTTDLLLLGGVAVAGVLVYNAWKKKQTKASTKVTPTIPELPKTQSETTFTPTEKEEPIFDNSGVSVSTSLVPTFSVPVEMENFA